MIKASSRKGSEAGSANITMQTPLSCGVKTRARPSVKNGSRKHSYDKCKQTEVCLGPCLLSFRGPTAERRTLQGWELRRRGHQTKLSRVYNFISFISLSGFPGSGLIGIGRQQRQLARPTPKRSPVNCLLVGRNRGPPPFCPDSGFGRRRLRY